MRRKERREGVKVVANFELEEEGQKTFFPPHRMEEKMRMKRMEKRKNRRQKES